jgi:hypothetical protein
MNFNFARQIEKDKMGSSDQTLPTLRWGIIGEHTSPVPKKPTNSAQELALSPPGSPKT